jgi:hypothetical protein
MVGCSRRRSSAPASAATRSTSSSRATTACPGTWSIRSSFTIQAAPSAAGLARARWSLTSRRSAPSSMTSTPSSLAAPACSSARCPRLDSGSARCLRSGRLAPGPWRLARWPPRFRRARRSSRRRHHKLSARFPLVPCPPRRRSQPCLPDSRSALVGALSFSL